MIPAKKQARRGKTHCDLCERQAPPIHEYAFRLNHETTHWFDLCDACGAVDRRIKNGFIVGTHHPVVRGRS